MAASTNLEEIDQHQAEPVRVCTRLTIYVVLHPCDSVLAHRGLGLAVFVCIVVARLDLLLLEFILPRIFKLAPLVEFCIVAAAHASPPVSARCCRW